MNVLALGAHPNDVETGCFGTLLRHVDEGDKVHVVVTTRGGYGHRSWAAIQREMKLPQQVLGVHYLVLPNRIGRLDANEGTVSQVDKIVASKGVELIYTNWYGDSHRDHRSTFEIALASARKKEVAGLYCYELPRYVGRSQFAFKPSLFVGIEKYMARKLKSIQSYGSAVDRAYIGEVKGMASFRGAACHAGKAEAFETIFEKR